MFISVTIETVRMGCAVTLSHAAVRGSEAERVRNHLVNALLITGSLFLHQKLFENHETVIIIIIIIYLLLFF